MNHFLVQKPCGWIFWGYHFFVSQCKTYDLFLSLGITIPTIIEPSKKKSIEPKSPSIHILSNNWFNSVVIHHIKNKKSLEYLHLWGTRSLDVGRILLVTVLAGGWDAGQFRGPLHKFVHGLPQMPLGVPKIPKTLKRYPAVFRAEHDDSRIHWNLDT